MNKNRLPKGAKEWAEYWKEWEKLAKPPHDVTQPMAEEYYDYMDGNRRYLSFADTITMGQLETLRELYENKKYMDQFEEAEFAEPTPKRRETEEKWKSQQRIPQIEPLMFRKEKETKTKAGPRNTKWTRVKRYGVLQLRLRELEKPKTPNYYYN